MSAEVIDASQLPRYALGHRAPAWWGNLLFMIIEGASFLLLVASYLYVQSNELDWPPEPPLHAGPGLLTTVSLLVSCGPLVYAYRAAGREDKRATRRGLIIGSLLTIATLPFRWHEIASLTFSWHDSAYGSLVWSMIGLHVIESIIGAGELVFVTIALFVRPDKRHFSDAQLTALFWFFVVGLWVPLFALIYGDGAYG